MTNKNSIQSTNSFYLNLVDFLCPLYPNIDKFHLIKLSQISYSYYQFLLQIDTFIDFTPPPTNN
jgi:hypothetical protein